MPNTKDMPKTKKVPAVKLLPMHDYVLIEPHTGPKKVGGLYIPQSAQKNVEAGARGKVLAIGPKCVAGRNQVTPEQAHPLYRIGDTVLYNEHASFKANANTVELVVVREEFIFAVALEIEVEVPDTGQPS